MTAPRTNGGVVAAQLQDRAAEASVHNLAHVHANLQCRDTTLKKK
jgi:hypothetical protein